MASATAERSEAASWLCAAGRWREFVERVVALFLGHRRKLLSIDGLLADDKRQHHHERIEKVLHNRMFLVVNKEVVCQDRPAVAKIRGNGNSNKFFAHKVAAKA